MHDYACIIILRVLLIPFPAFDVAVKPSGQAIQQMIALGSLHLNSALIEEDSLPILFSFLWSCLLSPSLPAPPPRSGISRGDRFRCIDEVNQRHDLDLRDTYSDRWGR